MNPDYKTRFNRIYKLHSVFIMQSIPYLTTLLCLALLPVSTFAWSATGHMSVAQIAYERLHPAAKKHVDRLISIEARDDVIDSIEMCSNSWRTPSYLGYVSPNAYEKLAQAVSFCVRFYLTNTPAIRELIAKHQA